MPFAMENTYCTSHHLRKKYYYPFPYRHTDTLHMWIDVSFNVCIGCVSQLSVICLSIILMLFFLIDDDDVCYRENRSDCIKEDLVTISTEYHTSLDLQTSPSRQTNKQMSIKILWGPTQQTRLMGFCRERGRERERKRERGRERERELSLIQWETAVWPPLCSRGLGTPRSGGSEIFIRPAMLICKGDDAFIS